MTSDRRIAAPSRPRPPPELLATAGTQFDPEVVDAFLVAFATSAPEREPIDGPIRLAAHRVRTLLAHAQAPH